MVSLELPSQLHVQTGVLDVVILTINVSLILVGLDT
jgi:hypothetical protein